MKIIIVCIIVQLSSISTAWLQLLEDKILRCPPHEHEGCAPCPCWEPTCQDRNPECPTSGVCAPICKPKCLCNESYIRNNSTGRCIPIDRCPKLN
uniref:Cysteine-rich venom protein 1-like n=1 Tax=Diabrotica virgifera virgifera TaxID=50390 RepID=A0A6P7GTD4_DIAVI